MQQEFDQFTHAHSPLMRLGESEALDNAFSADDMFDAGADAPLFAGPLFADDPYHQVVSGALCENLVNAKGRAGGLLSFEMDACRYQLMMAQAIGATSRRQQPAQTDDEQWQLAFGLTIANQLTVYEDHDRGKMCFFCIVPEDGGGIGRVPVQLLRVSGGGGAAQITFFQWIGEFEYSTEIVQMPSLQENLDTILTLRDSMTTSDAESMDYLSDTAEPLPVNLVLTDLPPIPFPVGADQHVKKHPLPVKNIVHFPAEGDGHPNDVLFDWYNAFESFITNSLFNNAGPRRK